MLAFLISPVGRWLAGALAALALIVGFAVYQRHKGAEHLQQQINTQNQEAGDAAKKARDDAARRINADPARGLCDDWSRDCPR